MIPDMNSIIPIGTEVNDLNGQTLENVLLSMFDERILFLEEPESNDKTSNENFSSVCNGSYANNSINNIDSFNHNIHFFPRYIEHCNSVISESNSMSCISSQQSETSDDDNNVLSSKRRRKLYKYNPKPLISKPSMRRNKGGNVGKSEEYVEKRKKNNEASRRSRLARRNKECLILEEINKLKEENDELRAQLKILTNDLLSAE